jgi:glucose-1-phosphate cytidylyltransferase
MPLKTVILAGGYGTRLSEETAVRPKPMVEIGERPILWHIMKGYESHGVREFVICCGYKSHVIKDYFANYALRHADVTVDLAENELQLEARGVEPWRVHLVETGDATMTGGRLKRARDYIGDEPFHMTYGDGVADIDLDALTASHGRNATLATITAVQPPGRFGVLDIDGDGRVNSFREKPQAEGGWINGGFMLLSPKVLDYVAGDATPFESEPLSNLARDGQLGVYRHAGFWQAMDTLRDKRQLEDLWSRGKAPWKTW